MAKFMMSQRGEQTIAVHILKNISRSKSSEVMKFGQFYRVCCYCISS